jgi:hypothetical protein
MTDVDRDLIPFGGAAGVSGTAAAVGTGGAGTGGATGGAAGGPECELPTEFRWTSTGPLIGPISDAEHDLVSIKDPTVVRFEDRWHIYATTATRADDEGESASWSLVYLNFTDWAQAGSAEQVYIDVNEELQGYHAAPQLFYFTPQETWYLIYQSQPPQYSTSDDISDPSSWSAPQSFFHESLTTLFADNEEDRPELWIDYWVVCDETHCYLFFTGDNGKFYRSRTEIDQFPDGMTDPVVALQVEDGQSENDLFEGSATYKIRGENRYLTLIEAIGPTGKRYYRSFVADTLDGEWTPLADTWESPFAGPTNVISYDDVPSAGGAGGSGGLAPGGAAGSGTSTAAGDAGTPGAAGTAGALGAGGAVGGIAGAPSAGGADGSAGAPGSVAGAAGQSGTAGATQVPWTVDISHGELLRDGYDQTMTINACNLQLLYQGRRSVAASLDYSQLPYRLGLLTLAPAEETDSAE